MQPEIFTQQATLTYGKDGQALLAIDTSLGTTVAVSKGQKAWQFISSDPMGHTETIAELIMQALQVAELRPRDITGVVMGTGPGSFTGLRVGMAAAKAFAAGIQKPLLPIISHDAHAVAYDLGLYNCIANHAADNDADSAQENTEQSAVRVVQDARRRELFITDYVLAHNENSSIISKIALAAVTLGTGHIEVDNLEHRQTLRTENPRVVKRENYQPSDNDYWPETVSGIALLHIATQKLALAQDFAKPSPVYLRDPDVRPPAGVKPVVGG